MDQEKKVRVALHTVRTSRRNLTFSPELLYSLSLNMNIRYCVSFEQKHTQVTEDGMSVKFWGNHKMTLESVS